MLEVDLLELSQKDGLIFDIGANTGRAARWFSKAFPNRQIWSFEPGREAFDHLSAAPDLRHVRKFKLALSDKEETANLNLFHGSELNSLLPQTMAAERYNAVFIPTGIEQVQTVRLDTFCERHQISKIEILKVDTQGFELHVLRGAERLLSSGSVNLIHLELNLVPVYQGQPTFSDVFDGCLSKFGFGVVGFYDVGRDENGCIKNFDALFKLNRKA